MPPNPMSMLMANIQRSGRQMRRSRMSGFRETGDVVDAIYGNLTSFIGRRGTRLTGQDRRVLNNMRRLAERMEVSRRQTSARERDIVSRYGGAFAANMGAGAFAPAHARAQAGVMAGQADVGAARMGLMTGQGLVGIAQAGAEQAQAGAEYGTARALQVRTQEDVAMLAQMRHEALMAQMQQQFEQAMQQREFEQQRKMFQLEARQTEREMGENDFAGFRSVAGDIAEGSRLIRGMLEQNPDVEWQHVQSYLAEQGLINEANAATTLSAYRTLFSNLRAAGAYSGGGANERAAEVQAILETIRAYYPTWFRGNKRENRLEKYIRTQLDLLYSSGMSSSAAQGQALGSAIGEIADEVAAPPGYVRSGTDNSATSSPVAAPLGYVRGG